MELISAGEMFRRIAKEKKLQLDQFSELAENNDEFDRQIDEMQGEEAMKRENVIIESRLSGFFVPKADLKIWLKKSQTFVFYIKKIKSVMRWKI